MEKIIEVLENPEMARRMGNYGRKRVVEQLQWKHETPKLLRAYQTLDLNN